MFDIAQGGAIPQWVEGRFPDYTSPSEEEDVWGSNEGYEIDEAGHDEEESETEAGESRSDATPNVPSLPEITTGYAVSP